MSDNKNTSNTKSNESNLPIKGYRGLGLIQMTQQTARAIIQLQILLEAPL